MGLAGVDQSTEGEVVWEKESISEKVKGKGRMAASTRPIVRGTNMIFPFSVATYFPSPTVLYLLFNGHWLAGVRGGKRVSGVRGEGESYKRTTSIHRLRRTFLVHMGWSCFRREDNVALGV